MEQQFNRRHGAKRHKFELGQSVLARDYRRGHDPWILGEIIGKRGSVMYEVRIGTQTWIRHTNQLRPTHCQAVGTRHANLPFDSLLDGFNLPKGLVQDHRPSSDTVGSRVKQPRPKMLQPRRWTDRHRTPSRRIQVNPRNSSYTAVAVSEGEVSGRN